MYDERYGNWNTEPAEDIFAGVFVSGHKFYVCDFRTKHKICISYLFMILCFCVFRNAPLSSMFGYTRRA
jgi:hypothetical protein